MRYLPAVQYARRATAGKYGCSDQRERNRIFCVIRAEGRARVQRPVAKRRAGEESVPPDTSSLTLFAKGQKFCFPDGQSRQIL